MTKEKYLCRYLKSNNVINFSPSFRRIWLQNENYKCEIKFLHRLRFCISPDYCFESNLLFKHLFKIGLITLVTNWFFIRLFQKYLQVLRRVRKCTFEKRTFVNRNQCCSSIVLPRCIQQSFVKLTKLVYYSPRKNVSQSS